MMVVAVGSPVETLVVKLVPVVYDVIESFDVGAVAELLDVVVAVLSFGVVAGMTVAAQLCGAGKPFLTDLTPES